MSDSADRNYSLQQALRAQKALRDHAGLPEEKFAVQEFIGMISDEIQVLRERGVSDEKIAHLIQESSGIAVDANDIAFNYAPPELRSYGHK